MMTPQIYPSSVKLPITVRRGQESDATGSDRRRALPGIANDLPQRSATLSNVREDALSLDRKVAIQKELCKVLESPLFVQSNRLSKFLSFAVETALEGNGESLKEYTIGIEAYGRRPEFEPGQDSIVRTEARRLRAKLKQYYQEEGDHDPIFIYFRPGSYVPIFHVNENSGCCSPQTEESEAIVSNGISIYVAPFIHSPCDVLAEACARGLTDEVIHGLTQTAGVRVFASHTWQTSLSPETKRECKHGTGLTLEGSVRTEENRIRVTSRLYDSDGLHMASWRSDFSATPGQLFDALEQIASKIAAFVESSRKRS